MVARSIKRQQAIGLINSPEGASQGFWDGINKKYSTERKTGKEADLHAYEIKKQHEIKIEMDQIEKEKEDKLKKKQKNIVKG